MRCYSIQTDNRTHETYDPVGIRASFPEDYPTRCIAYHTPSFSTVVKMERAVSLLHPSFTLRRLI